MRKKRLKCYLYTRVSTSMQVDGYSLDAQREKLRKYAEYEDMIIAGEYSDEGISGKNIQGRHEFQRMLNDIQNGKDDVSYVLVFKLSHFGRNERITLGIRVNSGDCLPFRANGQPKTGYSCQTILDIEELQKVKHK